MYQSNIGRKSLYIFASYVWIRLNVCDVLINGLQANNASSMHSDLKEHILALSMLSMEETDIVNTWQGFRGLVAAQRLRDRSIHHNGCNELTEHLLQDY